MSKYSHILFLVETNKKSKIDNGYILKAIQKYYTPYELTFCRYNNFYEMGTKTKYNSSDVDKKICNFMKEVKQANKKEHDEDRKFIPVVVFCIDLDKDKVDPEQTKLNDRIKKFATEKGYELVLFNRNIEEVFVGEAVPDSEKSDRARRFLDNDEINNIKESKLRSSLPSRKSSNLLLILDKYIKQEED